MNIIQVFSTPVWQSTLPNFQDHKEKFLQTVEEFRTKNPVSDIRSSAGNGYQSPKNLTNEQDMAPLFEFVCQMGLKAAFDLQFVNVDAYVTAAWSNIHDKRSCINIEHVHQDTFSGVFYLQVPEKSGNLVVSNPGINPLWQGTMLTSSKNKFNSDKLKIQPTEGTIYIWPSYLPHSVEPNDHDETRISISFNVICIPKEKVEHTF